jgi:hypothetical protein
MPYYTAIVTLLAVAFYFLLATRVSVAHTRFNVGSSETHASTPDPDARLYRKGPGQPAKLAYLGHVLMENQHALIVDTRLTLATGTAEREAGLEMVEARPGNHPDHAWCRQGL